MNPYPPIPPLDARQVKELVRQIRVIRADCPGLDDAGLAEEWAAIQRWRIGEHRPTPFAAWLATDEWEPGFMMALACARRLEERRARERALRARAKAWRQARRLGGTP